MKNRKGWPTKASHKNLEYATEPFFFTVELSDVIGSTVGDYNKCAAARACRSMKNIEDAWVSRDRTVLLFTNGKLLKYQNPELLTAAVDQYDKTAGMFPPGNYRLRCVSTKQRSGGKDGSGTHKKDGTRPHLSKPRKTYGVR